MAPRHKHNKILCHDAATYSPPTQEPATTSGGAHPKGTFQQQVKHDNPRTLSFGQPDVQCCQALQRHQLEWMSIVDDRPPYNNGEARPATQRKQNGTNIGGGPPHRTGGGGPPPKGGGSDSLPKGTGGGPSTGSGSGGGPPQGNAGGPPTNGGGASSNRPPPKPPPKAPPPPPNVPRSDAATPIKAQPPLPRPEAAQNNAAHPNPKPAPPKLPPAAQQAAKKAPPRPPPAAQQAAKRPPPQLTPDAKPAAKKAPPRLTPAEQQAAQDGPQRDFPVRTRSTTPPPLPLGGPGKLPPPARQLYEGLPPPPPAPVRPGFKPPPKMPVKAAPEGHTLPRGHLAVLRRGGLPPPGTKAQPSALKATNKAPPPDIAWPPHLRTNWPKLAGHITMHQSSSWRPITAFGAAVCHIYENEGVQELERYYESFKPPESSHPSPGQPGKATHQAKYQ